LSGARGPVARMRGGKGSYAGMANPAYVPAFGLLILLLLAAMPAAAMAQGGGTGGAQPQASPTPAPAPAPRSAPSLPPVRSKITLTRLACASGCGADGAVRPGALLRVRGTSMRRTAEVHFDGAAGDVDDVAAAPVKRRKTSVDVHVPLGAATGTVTVLDKDGVLTTPAPAPVTVEQPPTATPAAGGPSIDVDAQAPKAYFDAAKPMRMSYVIHDDRAVNVRVELLRAADQVVVASWAPGMVPPDTPQVVQWNGMAGGRVQKPGRYVFRVSAADEAGALRASSAQAPSEHTVAAEPDPASFRFLRHTFPVLGPHGFGEFAAKFGGGRGHQGQDVFAACGTPMVAARGGIVKFKQYHSRAGYYLVIDGERTAIDYAYMHLKGPALVNKGDRVHTGQLIGYVGDTGDASGCHLHFEMWSAPGWYSGGSPFDPLPDLLDWDKAS
jgi:murein DD-endopeptidase MepM/ murein hydrolase activator NlpD